MQDRSDAGAVRPLAVLAVLLGLLAMHGLASAHHAAASLSTTATTAHHVAQAAPAEVAALHHAAARPDAMPAAVYDAAALVGGTASCDDDCPSVAVLCLAVLAGAALALFLARCCPAPLLLAPARPSSRVPAPPVGHARGPDPVRELCVSRT